MVAAVFDTSWRDASFFSVRMEVDGTVKRRLQDDGKSDIIRTSVGRDVLCRRRATKKRNARWT